MSEKEFQGNLSGACLASLITTPVTGIYGLAFAATFLVGKPLRLLLNKKARENYEGETSRTIVPKKIQSSRQSFDYSLPESPEAILARNAPKQTANFLNKHSKRKNYEENIRVGGEVAKNYLNKLSQTELEKITAIKIFPEQETFFRRKSLEVKIKR